MSKHAAFWLGLLLGAVLCIPAFCFASTSLPRILLIADDTENSIDLRPELRREILALFEGDPAPQITSLELGGCGYAPFPLNARLDSLLSAHPAQLAIFLGAEVLRASEAGLQSTTPSLNLSLCHTADGCSGIMDPTAIDLQLIRDALHVKHAAVLLPVWADKRGKAHQQQILQEARRLTSENGAEPLRITLLPLHTDVQGVLEALPTDCDLLYLPWYTSLGLPERQELYARLCERGLKTVTGLGEEEVEKGALLGFSLRQMKGEMSRLLALRAQTLLENSQLDMARSNEVSVEQRRRPVLNQRVAELLPFSPSWDLLDEAVLIAGGPGAAHSLNLQESMVLAGTQGLELEALRLETEAARQDVSQARALLLPELEVGSSLARIDEDRAAASMGQSAEQTLSSHFSVKQTLFAEAAWANLSIQKRLAVSRDLSLADSRLDAELSAGLAYLQALMAEVQVRVIGEHLDRSREYRDLARLRQSAGGAGTAELHRWEAQLAQTRQELVSAKARAHKSRLELSRQLNLPLDESVELSDGLLPADSLVIRYAPLALSVENPERFELMEELLVAECLASAPALKQLDELIAVRERALLSSRLKPFVPVIGMEAQYNWIHDRAGEGSDGFDSSSVPAEFAPLISALLSEAPDENWQIGVGASLPLFTGGSTIAEIRSSKYNLQQARATKAYARQRLESALRSQFQEAAAAWRNISHARRAAEETSAAREAIARAYAQGAVGVLDLIDAQNVDRSACEAADLAVYTFLANVLGVERLTGQFSLLLDEDQAAERITRFHDAMRNNVGEKQ